MKRYFPFLICIILASLQGVAQRDTSLPVYVKDGKVEFYGVEYPCMIFEYPAPPEVLENALKEEFSSRGYKGSTKKGFLIYRSITLPRVTASRTVDAFMMVAAKSKKEKEKSFIYLVTAEPGKIPDGKPAKGFDGASVVIAGVGGAAFINGMSGSFEAKEHQRQVDLQANAVISQEKKVKNLQDDYSMMQKKLEKLQQDMEENQAELKNAQQKLEEERRKLSDMKNSKPGKKADPEKKDLP
jgi:hypothetical protein